MRHGAWLLALLSVPPALAAQGPPPLFVVAGRAHLPPDQAPARAVVLGDVDGDGDLDLVVGNGDLDWPGRDQDRLYLNDGLGGFEDATATHLPAREDITGALALGDVDGDGDLDLVAATEDPFDTTRLLLNDGKGHFQDAASGRLPSPYTAALAALLGDVDGDGDLDLILGNDGPNLLFLNDGKGNFQEATAGRLPAESRRTLALCLGDMDGDGDRDLFLADEGEQDRLLLNNGKGAFAPGPFPLPAASLPRTSAFALGDVDGDGDLDLVAVAGRGTGAAPNRLLVNLGQGRFVAAGTAQFLVDADASRAAALVDVDGDGDLDLVVANVGANRLYLNDGRGTFAGAALSGVSSWSMAVAAGDVDGDGDADLVFGDGWEQDDLLLNDGRGVFTLATSCPLPEATRSFRALALGDVDGDGDADLVAGGQVEFRLFGNDGKGGWTDLTATHLPAYMYNILALALGDLDGDGDLDLVVGGVVQGALLRNDGRGVFTAVAGGLPQDLGFSQTLALKDVDGDGDLDLVAASVGQTRLLRNDGRGGFADVTTTHLPAFLAPTYALALGDVDGDGAPDLVLGNWGDQDRLYLNDGRGVFAEATAGRLPARYDETRALALGDVDGDGDLDLVAGNRAPSGDRDRLYRNDGRGFFRDASAAGLPDDGEPTTALALADFDGDGDLDLVVVNDAAATAAGYSYHVRHRCYLNDGLGVFAEASGAGFPLLPGGGGIALAAGDLDGDGDPDAIVALGSDYAQSGLPGPQLSLVLNLTRQLALPHLPRLGKGLTLDCRSRPAAGAAALGVAPLLGLGEGRLEISPYGIFRLDPARLLVALPPALTDPASGLARCRLPVPADPALKGLRLHFQALAEGRDAAGSFWRLTNAAADALVDL